MRAGFRGSKTTSAFLTVAVPGSRGRVMVAYKKLESAGFQVAADPKLTAHRADGAPVLHAVGHPEREVIDELAAESWALASQEPSSVAIERASFQPIWSVWPTLGALGFELFVVDDDDATLQLDTFHAAFRSDSLLRDMKRSHITIRPRGRWRGYGRRLS